MKYFLKISFKNSIIFCLVLSILWLTGCGKPEKEVNPQFLIKTPLIEISSSEFAEELDLKKAAYPYDIKENQKEYNEMVIHLVKILSEEIVLLSAAADKQIIITDQEITSAEKEFKKDYPEDSFEQILLENAISYPLWKERFKKNMIMEKLIDQELKQKIIITPEDIVEFYNIHNVKTTQNSDNSAMILNKIKNEKELVTRLRLQKTQKNYDKWIQNLYKMYPVEINKDKLKVFLLDVNKDKEDKNAKEN